MALGFMCSTRFLLLIASMNHLVWRRLYHQAKTKYKLLG